MTLPRGSFTTRNTSLPRGRMPVTRGGLTQAKVTTSKYRATTNYILVFVNRAGARAGGRMGYTGRERTFATHEYVRGRVLSAGRAGTGGGVGR